MELKTFKRKKLFLISLLLILLFINTNLYGIPTYKDQSQPIEKRVEDVLSIMTLEEKVEMLEGEGFNSPANERLGIPPMNMTDGPVGVRWEKATAFPASVSMASTWNTDLVYQVGKAIGKETKARDRNVLLGPCICIHRVPHGGRNFESYGEDPYLASRMTVSFVKGIQSENVVATAKHYACNNQEYNRFRVDVKVDERTLHEIYLPAFKAAVTEGDCLSVMAAYNRVNGHYCCANTYLLKDILKEKWNFKGFIMSDWGAVHSVIPTLYAGLDIEMPTAGYLKKNTVLSAIQGGLIREEEIDDKVRRMLRTMFVTGIFDNKLDKGAINTPEHQKLALKIAEEGTVLLKNKNKLLPLNKEKISKIAVIGPNAKEAIIGGGGSSNVDPFYSVSILDGLKNKVGKDIEVIYERGLFKEKLIKPIESSYLRPQKGKSGEVGLLGQYFNNTAFEGKPVISRIDKQINFDFDSDSTDKRLNKDEFSIIWTGKLLPTSSGKYIIGTSSDDGTYLYLNGKRIVNNWGPHGVVTKTDTVELKKNKSYDIKVEYFENIGGASVVLGWRKLEEKKADKEKAAMDKAITAAKNSDVAIICVGVREHEGGDREELTLPAEQVKLIRNIASVNKNLIVVLNGGAAVLMNEWLDKVPVLIAAWYPGQEGGNALADIILGEINPSGKLPTTFIEKWEDSPAYGNYPEEEGEVHYEEGIFVGYRHFDKENIEPLFPFGYGLSYTTFKYSDLKINKKSIKKNEKIKINLKVENTGEHAGAEIVQLYVQDTKASVERPIKELKEFKKVFLKPGEKKQISFELDKSALSFYDIISKDWIAEKGKFKVLIGSSSKDIRLTGEFTLK
jgi:beta-glucosidase